MMSKMGDSRKINLNLRGWISDLRNSEFRRSNKKIPNTFINFSERNPEEISSTVILKQRKCWNASCSSVTVLIKAEKKPRAEKRK